MLRFGTDGIRGVANVDLTPEVVLALGRAAARVLGGWRFVVGRDPRLSGPLLEGALSAGLASEGAAVSTLGVVPTPVVAFASAVESVPGAVISASHNAFADNGVKLFAAGGRKLTEELEDALEAELHRVLRRESAGERFAGDAVGTITAHTVTDAYARAVVDSIDGRGLGGLRIVADCANGAASSVAPDVLRSLGASVEVINAEPDGTNINAGCGSTHPDELRRAVRASGAHAGVAFDGDADRVLLVDERGELVDGDQILAMCARDLHDRGLLTGNTVVVTVMTNLGFRNAMRACGVDIVETPVGDRNVLDALDAGGYALGGEQSGHIIFRERATTGDGLLTAVQALDVVHRAGGSVHDAVAAAMTKLPQVLRNVRTDGPAGDVAARLHAAVARAEEQLGTEGRVLVRPSGTEPVLRIMVEANTEDTAERVAADLVAAAESADD